MMNQHPDQQFFLSRGFGRRIGFGRRPAVLVIDLTRAFTDPDLPLGSDLAPQLQATNRLLDAAHCAQAPVFFSSVRYDDPQMRDAGIWALKQAGIATLLAAGDGHQLDPRLSVQPQDTVFYKKYASCFFGTDLGTRLVSSAIDTLLIAGTSTSGCVRASAVDACQLGFRPMVVSEAVGDRADAAHRQSLFDLDAKYADVVRLDACLEYLAGLGRVDAALKARNVAGEPGRCTPDTQADAASHRFGTDDVDIDQDLQTGSRDPDRKKG